MKYSIEELREQATGYIFYHLNNAINDVADLKNDLQTINQSDLNNQEKKDFVKTIADVVYNQISRILFEMMSKTGGLVTCPDVIFQPDEIERLKKYVQIYHGTEVELLTPQADLSEAEFAFSSFAQLYHCHYQLPIKSGWFEWLRWVQGIHEGRNYPRTVEEIDIYYGNISEMVTAQEFFNKCVADLLNCCRNCFSAKKY
jgi:hypothetical protein